MCLCIKSDLGETRFLDSFSSGQEEFGQKGWISKRGEKKQKHKLALDVWRLRLPWK